MLDTRASLPNVDYSEVLVCITIPAQAIDACGVVPLARTGSVWTLSG